MRGLSPEVESSYAPPCFVKVGKFGAQKLYTIGGREERENCPAVILTRIRFVSKVTRGSHRKNFLVRVDHGNLLKAKLVQSILQPSDPAAEIRAYPLNGGACRDRKRQLLSLRKSQFGEHHV